MILVFLQKESKKELEIYLMSEKIHKQLKNLLPCLLVVDNDGKHISTVFCCKSGIDLSF